jgi:glycosyltransferase involved in cell wall biosynthesis
VSESETVGAPATDQQPDPIVSMVVPVYKEGAAVEPILRALDSAVKASHEILVVYDFDEDPTVPVIARLSRESASIRGHRNDLGRGVLNALKAGLAASRGRYIVVTMADGSDEPERIDEMVRLADNGADIVAASRYMRGGRQIGGPRLKGLLSRAAGLSLHYVGGVATHDPTNNFKLYARRFLDDVTIESNAGFELGLELTVKATITGRRLAEIPTTWRDRTSGASNFKLRQWLPHYLRWYLVAMRRRRRGAPVSQGS